MTKKLFLCLLLVGLLAFSAGIGTYAWFTSSVTSGDNKIETGRLTIGLKEAGVANMDFTNLYPGCSLERVLDVDNKGTLPFNYKLDAIKESGSDSLYGILNITVIKNNKEEYSGPLNLLPNLNLGQLDVSGSDQIKFIVTMPETADNTFNAEGMSSIVQFVFTAYQTNQT